MINKQNVKFMRKLTFLLTCLFLVSMGLVNAQTKSITGKVISAEDGQPIIGATVKVKGTTVGTITNADGDFKISLQANAKNLSVSYVGMKAIDVEAKSNMVVKLESDAFMIDELVVTAVGIKRSQKALSYSVSQVNSEEITKGGDRSALNSLQGKIAGVSISSSSGAPGASSRIVLRGYSSIGGNNEPLFVVDGVPVNNGAPGSTSLKGSYDFGNRINDINPNDIASISVLKGASASALYGSRAANGVILITTKSGSQSSKLKVEIVSNTSFSSPLKIYDSQNTFGQGWSSSHELIENGSWGPKMDDTNRLWGNMVNNQQQFKSFGAQKTNVLDFYEVGQTYNNSIAISGGKENATFYTSYSNIYDDGILPTNVDHYKRNAFTMKGSLKNDFITTSAQLNYINKKVSAAQGGQGYSVYNNLLQIPRDFSIVDFSDYKSTFNNLDNYYTPYSIVNPYYTLAEDGNTINEDKVFGNVSIEANLAKWMKATVRVGDDFSNYQMLSWRAITKPQGNNSSGTQEPGNVTRMKSYVNEFNVDAFLSFTPTISESITMSGIVGFNLNARESNSLQVGVIGLDLPNFYELTNSSATPTVIPGSSKRRLLGAYFQTDIAYKNYVFLNLGFRNDWSSTLPKDANSFMYPTIGLSYVLTDAIPETKDIFSFAKFRASYGMTGNDPDPYSLLSVYPKSIVTYPFGELSFPLKDLSGNTMNGYEVGNTIGNPTLKPELTREIEVGADLRFFNSRLGFDLTYYKRNTKNQILDVPIAHSSGYGVQWMNLGNVQNQGFEVLVNLIPVKTKNFEWNSAITFSNNKNKVIELSPLLDKVSLGGLTTMGFYASEGLPMGYYEGTVAEKDPNGNIVVDASGLPIASATKENLGNTQADFMMGWTNTLTYKNFSLSCVLDIRKGGLIYSRTADVNYFVGNAPQTLYNDRNPFIVPNSVQKIPTYDVTGKETGSSYIENRTPISAEKVADYWNNGGSDMDKTWLLDKSNIRLRELVIGYSVPKKALTGKFISGVNLSIIGRNLLLFTPKGNRFIDPETTSFGSNIESEFGEFSSSPAVRNIGFSLKVTL